MTTSLARETNDVLADVVAGKPTRFAALAVVAPQDPEAAAEEIGRATGTLGFGGALIGSHTGGRYLDEPEAEPILAAIEETDSTLYLHPRRPTGPDPDAERLATELTDRLARSPLFVVIGFAEPLSWTLYRLDRKEHGEGLSGDVFLCTCYRVDPLRAPPSLRREAPVTTDRRPPPVRTTSGHQALAVGVDDGLDAVAESEFGEDA